MFGWCVGFAGANDCVSGVGWLRVIVVWLVGLLVVMRLYCCGFRGCVRLLIALGFGVGLVTVFGCSFAEVVTW